MGDKSILRQVARGQHCLIRIPGVCNGDPGTTVLCHLPGGGMAGKRSDLAAAGGCSDCHRVVDGEKSEFSRDTIARWLLEAVLRTQERLFEMGFITINIKDWQARWRASL